MTDNKLKILLFGSIASTESAEVFVAKLRALHTSKAGPFDVAFVVGRCVATGCSLLLQSLPIPVYLHDDTVSSSSNNSNNKSAVAATPAEQQQQQQQQSSSSPVEQLGPNLFVLRSAPPSTAAEAAAAEEDSNQTNTNTNTTTPPPRSKGGIWSLSVAPHKPNLVVAACPWNVRVRDHSSSFASFQQVDSSDLTSQLSHPSYTGCDLLLSHEWPQGIEPCMDHNMISSNNNNTPLPLLSFDVAHVALLARARYHVATGPQFGQSTAAFEHVPAVTSTVPVRHVGRFISLAPISSSSNAASVDKKRAKFVHALGITPLHSTSPTELEQQRPTTVLPCPFTDASYQKVHAHPNQHHHTTTASIGLSAASARRILQQERVEHGGAQQAQPHRWATTNHNKRPRNEQQQQQQQPVDPNNTVLFLHGLHHDVSGRLTTVGDGDGVLLQYFSKFGNPRIRRPAAATTTSSSSFCFLEFATHAAAAACLEETAGHVMMDGVHLTLQWRRTNSYNNNANENQAASHPKRSRLIESDAQDSQVLYFKLPPSLLLRQSNSKDDDAAAVVAAAGEQLRVWMEQTLEEALAAPDSDDGDQVERITAATEPALQVQVRMPQPPQQQQSGGGHGKDEPPPLMTGSSSAAASFGFLDFASHAAASMALATLTGSTDGGRLLDSAQGIPSPAFQGLYLHWARSDSRKKGHDNNSDNNNRIEGVSGFSFERKHFPADARKDCWFCLASESCEKHLITGVYDSCYAAMPKGPIHEGHVLLIPVKHTDRGALYDKIVAQEMDDLKAKLRRHATAAYQMDLFVFERAIQTKHGYHTHVQCIPIERQVGIKVHATMLAQARKLGIDLRELNSDLGLQAMLSNDNDDDSVGGGGYFYAELPITGKEYKRFLYKHHTRNGNVSGGGGNPSTIPLQFGREVLAAALGKPELAHWKSCVLEKEQEEAMATSFRESFGNFE